MTRAMTDTEDRTPPWLTGDHVVERDPLKIVYIVAQDDDRLDEVSPFQGFGRSWPSTLWALRFLAIAPASIVERMWPLDGLISQRMGGQHVMSWLPLSISTLEQIGADEIGLTIVALSGETEIADRVDAWIGKQPRPVLHVRQGEVVEDEEARAYCDTTLREHVRDIVEHHGGVLTPARLQAARDAIERWNTREPVAIALEMRGHNITVANDMVLARAERVLAEGESFVGESEAEYDQVCIESAQAVLDVRDHVGYRDFHRIFLPRPGLVLTEPALYRQSYARVRLDPGESSKARAFALRMLQKQTGLWNVMTAADALALTEDSRAQAIVAARQAELTTHMHGVGLMAAQTCSAVLRLRPAVNHLFPTLSRYARNIRATSPAARFKTPRLFDEVQQELADAIGTARLDLIAGYSGSIKLVSDAPLELLPVGNLPLSLRFDVSRINATPGNLMMGELVYRGSVTLSPDQLCKILIINGFSDTDALRNLVTVSVERLRSEWQGRVEIEFVRVKTRDELVVALNASDATILIFDGHGHPGGDDGIGGIVIDRTPIDVWSLRGEARVPPIVVLSACDTQGMDAATHATVGNGFIAAGARTVLATMLPITGKEGAVFVARLIYRLAHFIPAFLGMRHRRVDWCEIIAGMLRMTLATEIVTGLLEDGQASRDIRSAANVDINTGDPAWYDNMLEKIGAEAGLEPQAVERRARAIMARGETIRYIQLGCPESITIDDGTIDDQFFPPDVREAILFG